MATEDFTGYAETDSGTDITVTTDKCDVSTMAANAVSHVSKDKTANHFGDFEHLFKVVFTALDSSLAAAGVWAVCDAPGTVASLDTSNKAILAFISSQSLYLIDYAVDNSDYGTMPVGDDYYFNVERAGEVATLKFYNDAGRTDLRDTLEIVCGVDTYRYVQGAYSRGHATRTATMTYTVEDLDLQEAAGTTVTPSVVALTTSLFAPVLKFGIIPGLLSLSDTEYAPVLKFGIIPSTLALSLTEYAPVLKFGIIPSTLALSLTEYIPVLKFGIIPSTLALSLTELVPVLKFGIIPDVLALILTEYAPTIGVSGAGETVTPETLALILSMFAPYLVTKDSIIAETGRYGIQPTTTYGSDVARTGRYGGE